MAGSLAVQLIGANTVGDLQDYVAVLSALDMGDAAQPLKITTNGTIEVAAPIGDVTLPDVGEE